MKHTKKIIAIFWGGRSPEHDVSIVTGIQALQAIDRQKYSPFAIYVDTKGRWWVGKELENLKNYMPDDNFCRKHLTQVTIDITASTGSNQASLIEIPQAGLLNQLRKPKTFLFDIALLAFHGLYGEDGAVQGVLELANVPHTGANVRSSVMMMSKSVTKEMLSNTDIPLLPHKLIKRPEQRLILTDAELKEACNGIKFPAIVKPNHLGSSIGVAKVNNEAELNAVLPAVFKFDDTAIIEPFVENLCEYNVAVLNHGEEIITSAIEKPKQSDDLLDFKQKYLSSDGSSKTGTKSGESISQGMLSLTRDINPDLTKTQEANLRKWAAIAFKQLETAGAPRIDFLCNAKTGKMWLNEINPIPGSFGYFLWEASSHNPILFTELLNNLLDEAITNHRGKQLPPDPTPEDARLFKR